MFFNLDKCVGHVSENACKQITEAFGRRLKDSGVTRLQWIAMYYIDRDSGIAQKDLAERIQVTESSIGRLIDRMERDGFVRRERSNTDRRVILLQLTDKGNRVFQELLPLGVQFNNTLTEGISDEDLIIYERVLHRMLTNINTD